MLHLDGSRYRLGSSDCKLGRLSAQRPSLSTLDVLCNVSVGVVLLSILCCGCQTPSGRPDMGDSISELAHIYRSLDASDDRAKRDVLVRAMDSGYIRSGAPVSVIREISGAAEFLDVGPTDSGMEAAILDLKSTTAAGNPAATGPVSSWHGG